MKAKDNQQLIFTNATIYIDAERKINNLLVENGKVKDYYVDPAFYEDAKIVDLEGGFVYPGFNDSHVHIFEIGGFLGCADLFGCRTSDQIAEKVAELDKKLPEGEFFLGNGFYPDDYNAWSHEDLAKLDNASKNRPIFLMDQLGHNCIVNSYSMKKCGITAETPIPPGGLVVLENGTPTGMLRETAMLLASDTLFSLLKDDIIRKGAKQLFELWASMGYTSIVDLMGGPFGRIFRPELCMEMEKAGEVPIRINYKYTFYDLDEIDNCLKYKDKSTDKVRFDGLKLFIDGAYTGGEAWTTWKNLEGGYGLNCVYCDDSQGEKYNIYRIVEKVNDLGLDIHYHIQGDKGIEVTLDAIEKALEKKGELTSVHTFIHVAFITEEQIKRIKKLSSHVNITTQPGFWAVEEEAVRYYGERGLSCYPAKQLVDAGVSVGFSTDYSVSPLELTSPTKVMNIAMTGAGDPKNHPPLTMKDLIKGFSEGSAATIGISDTGKLSCGYWADFVVYERDLYEVSAEELDTKNPKVLSTWVGGRKVYESK